MKIYLPSEEGHKQVDLESIAYLSDLKKKNKNAGYALLQRELIRQNQKDLYSGEKIRGMGLADHLLIYMQLIFPDRDFFEWRNQIILLTGKVLAEGRKEFSISGCSNSVKTSTISMIVTGMWSIDPEYTTIYVSGPTKQSTDENVWGQIVERFSSMKDRFSWMPGQSIKGKIYLDNEKNPRAMIRSIPGENTEAILRGKKLIDPESGRGFIGVVFEEATEMPNDEAVKVGANLISNDRYISWWTGNFASVTDGLGVVMTPNGDQFVNGYDSLDVEEDIQWETDRGNPETGMFGIALRLDGHRSPNILSGETIYPYVLTDDYRQRVERSSGGQNSIEYMRNVRAFPFGVDLDITIIKEKMVRDHGGYRQDRDPEGDGYIFWDHTYPTTVFAYCDPAFGGGDDCVIGRCEVRRISGESVPIVWFPQSAMTVVNIMSGIDPDDQIVKACTEYREAHNVDVFAYDGSMRAHIVAKMSGRGFREHDSNIPPTDRIVVEGYSNGAISRDPITARNRFGNRNDEAHFYVQELILKERTAGWDAVVIAKKELIKRRWTTKNGKRRVEPKREYKRRNKGRSPNHADVIVGLLREVQESSLLQDGVRIYQSPQRSELLQKFLRDRSSPQGAGRQSQMLKSDRPQSSTGIPEQIYRNTSTPRRGLVRSR